MAALILIQLAAKATGDAEEDHSSAWVPAIYVGVWRNFLAPDFVLAPTWPLWLFEHDSAIDFFHPVPPSVSLIFECINKSV